MQKKYLKKRTDNDREVEWGDAADPNAISGDGSVKKIIELSYEEYLDLERAGEVDADTEYHISDWSESNNLRYTEEEVQEIVAEAVKVALANESRSAIMVTVGSNKTMDCTSAWGTTVIPWDYVKYNVGDRIPRILINCGHTYCTSCLSYYYHEETQRIRCPFCKKLVKHLVSIENLTLNIPIFHHFLQFLRKLEYLK